MLSLGAAASPLTQHPPDSGDVAASSPATHRAMRKVMLQHSRTRTGKLVRDMLRPCAGETRSKLLHACMYEMQGCCAVHTMAYACTTTAHVQTHAASACEHARTRLLQGLSQIRGSRIGSTLGQPCPPSRIMASDTAASTPNSLRHGVARERGQGGRGGCCCLSLSPLAPLSSLSSLSSLFSLFSLRLETNLIFVVVLEYKQLQQ